MNSAILKEVFDSDEENNMHNCIQELLFSSSEDDCWNEMEEICERNKRNGITNYYEEIVPTYSEKEFIMHFRVGKELFQNLSTRYLESEIYMTIQNHAKVICAEKQIAMFLWYAGHEACAFRDVGDRFNVAISTVHEIITRVIHFLSNMSEHVIVWPNDDEKATTSAYFYTNNRFPGVIGAIDGTHIQIDPPVNGPDDYINRKGYHSIILQGIANEKRRFIDIFVGFPGSTHNARVFRSSPIFDQLENLCGLNYIIGDSAYSSLKSCLVPYRDNGHLTSAQRYFNRTLSSIRIYIEHTFGLLKQRFRQLNYLKLRNPERICHFIRACCVLHNLCGDKDLIEENTDDGNDSIPSTPNQCVQDKSGPMLRDEICQQLFLQM